MIKEKGRKGLISKTLERCRSLGHQRPDKRRPATPAGFFSVYVGPQRERFVVRTDLANHPLFRRLFDEAEMEYGYKSDGPLEIPCNVQFFNRVLREVEEDQAAAAAMSPACGLMRGHTGYRLLSSSMQAETSGWNTRSRSFS